MPKVSYATFYERVVRSSQSLAWPVGSQCMEDGDCLHGDVACVQLGADAITVDEFLYCYKPSQIAMSSGFWTFNGRQKRMKLITGLPTSNREWKDGFVFICGDKWEGLPWEERDEDFIHIC
jgi:hypothetical protein